MSVFIYQLREAHIDIPIMLASGSVRDLPAEDIRQIEQCAAVLAKPFSAARLVSAVGKA